MRYSASYRGFKSLPLRHFPGCLRPYPRLRAIRAIPAIEDVPLRLLLRLGRLPADTRLGTGWQPTSGFRWRIGARPFPWAATLEGTSYPWPRVGEEGR